jgi:hypothetical protein
LAEAERISRYREAWKSLAASFGKHKILALGISGMSSYSFFKSKDINALV